MAVEDLRTFKVANDPDTVAHKEDATQKRKRKRTPHGEKMDKVDNASMQQEPDSSLMEFDTVDGSSRRKEKKEKKLKKSADTVEVEDVTPDVTLSRQKKQKRAIEFEVEAADTTSAVDAAQDSPQKKKRKLKQDTNTIVSQDSHAGHSSPQRTEGASKRKRACIITPEEADVDVEAADKRENLKRNKKHLKSKSADESTEAPATSKIKKKKRSKSDDFPNPNGDSNLSESALKALEYVHANVTSTPDWKFNKARQNWIIRNLWDDAIVPDLYFPSCVKYLSGVQGNTRDVLIKSSKDILEKGSAQATEAAKATSTSLVKATAKVRFPDDNESEAAKGRLEDSKLGDAVKATANASVEKTSDGSISPGKAERARIVLEGLDIGTT